jgi:hypothetical protein
MKNFKDIKTFDDACKVLNLDSDKVIPELSCYSDSDRAAMAAHAKLMVIIKAANMLENDGKEWKPNWENFDEYKYQPYFDLSRGSSGFRYDGCGLWGTSSDVGSRLCFKSRELAEYISNQFIDLYNDYFIK